MTDNRRYYRNAEITIQVDSDLPFSDSTFNKAIELFRVDSPGDDLVTIHHHFGLPDLSTLDLSKEVYRKTPWAIYRQSDGWLYLGISPTEQDKTLRCIAKFDQNYSHTLVYHPESNEFKKGDLQSLSMLITDQILIARLLADRRGCYLHSAGAILNAAGMLFVGHSGAGKSTTSRLLMQARYFATAKPGTLNSPQNKSHDVVAEAHNQFPGLSVEILCDDRNIIRRFKGGWRVYGSWNHGDIVEVSPDSSVLGAVLFLQQDKKNELVQITDRKEIWRRLLSTLIKPMVTADWWQKEIDMLEHLVKEVPFYTMHFDMSGNIVNELEKLSIKNALHQTPNPIKSTVLP
ncbi:MAG: hypothetical protein P4L50_12725 [Anaerolineaceae bacterium]|nr:hypothetical protein [Anaerolineaceae bacterium]